MKQYKFSILMPVYNGADVIKDALVSILRQDYNNYEIFISDDCSKDNVKQVLKEINSPKIYYYRNSKNLGYGKNMNRLRKLIPKDSDVVFLMAQDDILAKSNLKKINEVFNKHHEVGAVIRPFYMFADKINVPIRDFGPYDRDKDTVLSIYDGYNALEAIFRTVCQLSGLAFRTKLIKIPFHQDVMTSHTYPFFDISKKHKIMYLKDYSIAVRTKTSQTRHVPNIYRISPTQVWINMINSIFPEKKFKKINNQCIKIILHNGVVGLIQIKNFSTFQALLREYWVIIKNRPLYIFNLRFLFYLFVTLFFPSNLLLPLVDSYKENVLSLLLKKSAIKFVKA